ncbi:DUF4184 family protein [Frankia sp. QA3]|uniref:DUF4184 family protein n=1 Tax=Frankia sp. QA3 TaxID=710111 RepID=UPI000269CF6F|nr:DUF4184 family protein [Frankia sp. QA3]EIV96340.1 hypothetical protein FraQA3DRAFT_6228 [Frankia sp. QA3]
MPFTLSHPAAVLPLRWLGLPMSAMVAGSMVPDVPVFFGWPEMYRLTHSLLGVVTVVPVLSLAALGMWSYLIRDAVVDLAPDPVRLRLPARARLTGRQWLLAPVAAGVGAVTHVGWDDFTHEDRWGVRQVAWLSAQHGALPGYKWLQYGMSAAGLVVVAAAIVAHLRALPRGPRRPRRHPSESMVLPAVVIVAAGVGGVVGLANVPHGLHAVTFHGVVTGVMALVAGLLLVAVGWQAATRGPTVE